VKDINKNLQNVIFLLVCINQEDFESSTLRN